MASDDLTRQQHDVVVPPTSNQNPMDDDEDQIAGGEQDIDEDYEQAFGNKPEKPIAQAVNEDEIARVKDLPEEEQKSSKSS